MSAAETYGAVDRALHRLAFSTLNAQMAVADIESRIYGDMLTRHPIRRPVFITSLPRAGTTLLLELLNPLPDFAAHSYRVMPFVLCPMLWDKISRPFRRPHESTERAHGDGVAIGFDSPEAFEEIVWLRFWQEHYHVTRIEPWKSSDVDEDFEIFLRDHMRKIVSLGDGAAGGTVPRYLSKNNANIGRLDLLIDMFPDARIVVPVRNPWAHACSMLNQHRRFTRLHAEDAFSRRYMEWLGHFEFGAAHRPIDFGGWINDTADSTPGELRYWLVYWAECYGRVLEGHREQIVVVDYDRLCAHPRRSLSALATALDLRTPDHLLAQANHIRPTTAYDAVPDDGERAALLHCGAIYAALTTRAI